MSAHAGGCHCGNVTVTFESEKPIADLATRFCTCSFCRKQNARYASDPNGQIRLSFAHPEQLARYRFGTAQADFMSCQRCGVYVGAVAQQNGQSRMVLNVNALDDAAKFGAPEDFDYDGEDPAERKDRWFTRWTPVVIERCASTDGTGKL